ncbi:Tetratricopeptide repeat protein 1 [Nymphaea thermarum]|nr:Tetratricopeptide repeat protein 1 [Nymphaea thermarum]
MGKPSGRKKKHLSEKTNDVAEKQHRTRESPIRSVDEDTAVFVNRAYELKEEGNIFFQRREHGGAIAKYEQALKLLPSSHIDRAYLHSNLAACYMQLNPPEYDKAINECNLALLVASKYSKALLKRARCYEALDRLDLALIDVTKVLNVEPNNMTALELSERLKKEIEKKGLKINGIENISEEVNNSHTAQSQVKRPGKGGSKKKKSSRVQDKPILEENPKEEAVRSVKLVFGDDIRWAHVPLQCGIRQLREIVSSRFPCLKGFLIKYKDQDGDLVTITITEEIRWAEESVGPQGLLRLYIFEVRPEQDPLFEEIKGGVETENSVSAHNNCSENGNSVKCLEHGVHIDTWIVQFAQMFKNHVGIDSDAYLDLHDLGMKLYTEAMEDVVTCEEAQDLFDVAANKFQEMVALAFFNWGNIHMSKARRRALVEEDASNEDALPAKAKDAYEWAHGQYVHAEERYKESLKIKPDFYEGFLALGQQQFEQAKLCWYFAVGTKVELESWDASEIIELFNSAEDNMEHGAHMWEEIEQERLDELKAGPKSNSEKFLLQKMGLDGILKQLSPDEAAEQAANMRSQINLLWGTMLYERSVIEFKLGLETWRECLVAAVDRFKLAGASPTDIAVMKKNHCSNATAQEGVGFKIDEIVQAWNEIYDAKKWISGVPSFRLEPLFRRRVPKLLNVLEHL